MTSVAMDRNAGREAADMKIGAYTASFGISLGLTNVFNALLVVIKETNEDTVLAWMKSLGHHWVTHGALDLIVFVALGLLLARTTENWRSQPNKVTAVAIGGVVVGGLIIAGFFSWGML